MEAINIIKGVRDLREQSAAKDVMAENPDYASNPEIIDKIGAIAPDLGNQLRGTLPKALELREQRAASGALWAKRALSAGMKAYQGALGAPVGELGETEEGMPLEGRNYAAADKAAQAMYGRFRRVMKDKGFNVDQLLPPVWSLANQERLDAEYGAITDAMRTPYNVVKPDGSAETMYFLPGEDAEFAATMKKGGQPVRVEKIGQALGVKTAGANALDDKQRAEVIGQVGDDFFKASENFSRVGSAYRNMVSLAKDPSGPADIGIIYNYMKMLDPGSTVMQGEYATAQNSGSIPDTVRNMYNQAISGKKIDMNRDQFLDAAGRVYKEREREQDVLESGLKVTQRALKLRDEDIDAVRARVARVQAPERAPRAAPVAQPEGPPTVPPPPAAQAAARETYQTYLNLARSPDAFAKATPAAQEQAFRALKDDDLRGMAVDVNKLNPTQTERLWDEYKRRGWISGR